MITAQIIRITARLRCLGSRWIRTLYHWLPENQGGNGGFFKGVAQLEESLVVGVLLLMGLLPLLEATVRRLSLPGVPGSAILVQQLVLVTAVLGAAIAVRKGELLSLATGSLLSDKIRRFAEVFTSGVGVVVCAILAVGSFKFVQAEREGERLLAIGVPVWVIQSLMPLGFTLIGLRILSRVKHRRYRFLATSFLFVPVLLMFLPQARDGFLYLFLLSGVAAAAALGAPIFVALAGIAIVLLWSSYELLSVIPLEMYNLTTDPILPTIPLFTMAGYILAEGGTPKRLVLVFRSFFGWMPGGVAVVAVLVCAFFTSFTGGSGVTILAMGGLLYPMLIQEKHSHRFSTGLLTSAGSLGLLFPPSLAVILLGVVAQFDIRRLFLSGLVPALIEILLVSVYVLRLSGHSQVVRVPFDIRQAWSALGQAKWELAIPVIVLASILSGIATLVEAAAVTLLYAFTLEFFVRRDLSIRTDLVRVGSAAATLIGGVLIILGVAMGLTNYLVIAGIPEIAVEWVQSLVSSRLVFLLLLNIFLLLVGCLMDVYSAITVVIPLIVPVATAFGVDPFHLGVIFLVNLELGYLTPPVGMNLFLASYRFRRPLPEVYRASLPFLAIRIVAVLLITYVPAIANTLPALVLPV